MPDSSAVPLSALPSICMGQLLLYGGFIDTGLLQSTLRDQRRCSQKLGDLLEQQHAISSMEKQAVMQLQAHLRALPLSFKPDGCLPDALQLSLGQLLLDNGEITREQLDHALADHQRQHRRLGEVLVQHKAISPDRLGCWLQLQKKLVAAAATAMLMLGYCGTASAGENHAHFWDHFRFNNKSSADDSPSSELRWGQQRPQNLSGLSTVQRALGELVRSSDGSTVVSVSRNGLEIVKRF